MGYRSRADCKHLSCVIILQLRTLILFHLCVDSKFFYIPLFIHCKVNELRPSL